MPEPRGAGALDRRITIRRVTLGTNDFNEPTETWADYRTVWASKQDASAGEKYRAAEVNAEITTRFVVRWSTEVATVTPQDRVAFKGVEYNVVAVRDIGRNEWREIDCVARAEEIG